MGVCHSICIEIIRNGLASGLQLRGYKATYNRTINISFPEYYRIVGISQRLLKLGCKGVYGI